MKNAVILHGYPNEKEYFHPKFRSPNSNHWLAWLQAKLLQKGIYAETPIMPNAYKPDYNTWKKAVERCAHIDEETIIVGHSCGGGFWLRYLSENPDLQVGKVVLVAPWLDPNDDLGNDFFKNFELDPDLASRTKGLTIFASSNDAESISITVERVRSKVAGVKVVDFENYGHFCINDMKTEEFPELLEEVLS